MGEGKMEMYEQLPPLSYPKSIYISPLLSFKEANDEVINNGFVYPFAVKPDVGLMGLVFRKIDTQDEYINYHQKMPVAYIVQELVRYPVEVSLFYYRFPNEKKGTMTGFISKELLEVTGDGVTNLNGLISRFELRPGFNSMEWRTKHAARLDDIIPSGETYRLSWTANLSRGSRLVNIEHEKDEQLQNVFDSISHYAKHYYGRYDIKCKSIEDLKAGQNFSILEFNGCGAEPHHAYGNGNTLLQACKIFLQHWNVMYKISKINHRQGFKYWSFNDGWKFLKDAHKHIKLLRKLDKEIPV